MSDVTAAAYFAARLAFETDVSDVHADLEAGVAGLVVVDARGAAAWERGRVPGALHLPASRVAAGAPALVDPAATVVTYCWGPACNGATRAALEFARLGYRVKEMLGGFEYWVREGLAYATDDGLVRPQVDGLTAPADATCGC
ncbi:molybdopterin biosynthesis protein MoeB [Actinomadura rubteroloni]|uniref:Molybdopterin biosynthesis protein MoeB n=1 Tax=Actinomadura rubteroloni TaxID=1926885 RepID=A0A2P4UFE2_9ACTN|nr:rhodanese-like domain-containing protein [Actinomadura rubteroloni]POM23780.1 molybdopterin biosynthesis protein MoeB [Actinomadura rubteroloni]